MAPRLPANAQVPGPGKLLGNAAPPPPPEPTEGHDGGPPAGGLLRREWVQNVLPFVTSLAAHAAAIALLVLTIKVVEVASEPKKPEEQTIPAKSVAPTKDPATTPGGVLFQGPADLPIVEPKQDKIEAANASGFSTSDRPSVDVGATGDGSTDTKATADAIGGGKTRLASTAGGTGGPGGPFGTGTDAGPLAGYGKFKPGGGKGPKGTIFGPGFDAATKVVFVCDATGTMISKLPVLKQELVKTVSSLRVPQFYNIVFFHDGGKVLVAGNDGLLPANGDAQRKTFQWLDDVTPAGTTDPIPAIERAFAMQPDLVYFLSDGEFNNIKSYEQVIEAVNRANVGKRARVNTILFDTLDADAAKAMDRSAAENGGKYAFVKEEDIGKAP